MTQGMGRGLTFLVFGITFYSCLVHSWVGNATFQVTRFPKPTQAFGDQASPNRGPRDLWGVKMKLIDVSTRKLPNTFAMVDDVYFEWLMNGPKWRAYKDFSVLYAIRDVVLNGKRTSEKMHRLILQAPQGFEVDHKNGNGLDNRLENIRLCTRSQNACNSSLRKDNKSGFKGVEFHKGTRCWRARICVEGCRTELGYFASLKEATFAYNQAAIRLHGDRKS